MGNGKGSLTALEMAQELDAMERGVTSWEADFLNTILTNINRNVPLTQGQQRKLEELYEHYLGDEAEDPDEEVDL
jgi:hypothetical protein